MGTGLDLGAYAVGGSWGWAEQETPSAAEEVVADRPADWPLPLLPTPGGAGPSVPYSLAAFVACDAAFAAAVAAAAAVGDSQLLGAAGTGYGWPFQGLFRALLPVAAAASSAVVLRCLGTVKAWRCGSCSFAELEGSSLPWVAGAAAVVVAGAGQPFGRLPAWGSCSAWLDWSGPPADLAW